MDELWKLCFPYCEPSISDPLTVMDGEKVVSMLSRARMSVCGFSAVYIYGVATHPDYRNRGYAGRLIKEVLKTGYAAIVPETPSLVDFYAKFGFVRCGSLPDGDGRALLVCPALDGCACIALARAIKDFEEE